MDTTRLARFHDQLLTHLASIDELALVVLKGHLIIEEQLSGIISRFVFHPQMLELTRLNFSQKVAIARAISLDEHENTMWDLILSINTLRNDLAHALESTKKKARIDKILALFTAVREPATDAVDATAPDHERICCAIALCVGFLSSFDAEIERYREVTAGLDQVFNPHRHPDSTQSRGGDPVHRANDTTAPGSFRN